MSDEFDLQTLIKQQVEESLQWKEENLDPLMEKATEYYMGEPYGDEREGRSQVRTREVRNAVAQALPSILRVFTASERVAEFRPRGPEDVELAKIQTEIVNYIFFEQNEGFLDLHAVLKDALVRKLGVLKTWWEERDRVEGSTHTGLTAQDLEILEADPTVDRVEILSETTARLPIPPSEENPEGGEADIPVYEARVFRILTEGRARLGAVPPEEMVWSPYAKKFDDCVMVGHVRDVTVSELLEMGAPREEVEDRVGRSPDLEDGMLQHARRIDGNANGLFDDAADPSMRSVRLSELYVRYDSDNDGIAELHKILAIGDDYWVWEDELVDEHPFSFFRVDPEPHTIIGLCTADDVMDLQHIISHVTRGMLDSLVAHLNPAMEVVESEVNMADALAQELGRVIRVRRPGQLREIVTPFVGGAALPVLEQLQSQVDARVGTNAMTDGLAPDALQSTTAAAVQATVEAARQRLELQTRILAETGMKDVFRKLLRLIVRHQDKPMVARIKGQFISIDPRHWDADKDVVVNVALGSGMVDQKISHLMAIASKQEEHLQQGSPLVDFASVRSTYASIAELMGFKNPDRFFKPFGPAEQQQFAAAQAENATPSDSEILERIEMAKIQARSQEKMAELQLKEAELQLRRLEIELQHQSNSRGMDIREATAAVDASLKQAKARVAAQMSQLQGLKMLSETRVGEG